MKVKVKSCPALSEPMDCSLPGSSIHAIFQGRTLEWVAISFSNAWKWKMKVKSLSRVRLLANPWTAAYQTPPSMGFSRQEYWSGMPLPSLNKYVSTCKKKQKQKTSQPKKSRTRWLHRWILSNIWRRVNTYPSKTLPQNCRGRNSPKLILWYHHHPVTQTR